MEEHVKKKIIWIVALIAILAAGGVIAYRKFFAKPEIRVLETGHVEKGDNRLRRKVALIGRTTAEKLFGEENPVGKTILIWRGTTRTTSSSSH
jgi:hypothetical protein